MLRKRHSGEKVIHGDVATCVSKSTTQLLDNVFPQILLNFFPWLSPRVNYTIYCIGDACITNPEDLYAVLGGLAWHVLYKLAPTPECHKLFVHSDTITGDESLSAVDQEQVPYIAEGCHMVCFQSEGSGPLIIEAQGTANVLKSSNSHSGLVHGII